MASFALFLFDKAIARGIAIKIAITKETRDIVSAQIKLVPNQFFFHQKLLLNYSWISSLSFSKNWLTKLLAGLFIISAGEPICTTFPSFIIQILSASFIASFIS